MKTILSNAIFLSLFLAASLVQADYKPYILGDVAAEEVKSKLEAEKFQIIGEYKPYADATVIVVTNDALKQTAAKSENGGYGAVMRVAIGDGAVSYTNPSYWANGYRMATNLEEVKTALEKALGNKGEFGSKNGMTKKQLRKYHYMFGMPYFDDQEELYTYPTYNDCVKQVEAGLKSDQGDKGKTKFVYSVDIPNKDETVFGMGLVGDHAGADENVMATLNQYTAKPEHIAYMPYELLCSGTKAYILAGKFRIALSFPDLSMWQFMQISTAPGNIEKAAKAAAKP